MILRLRDTVEDVVDLLPGLLSWMLVGVANTCVTLQWESAQSTHSRNGEKNIKIY